MTTDARCILENEDERKFMEIKKHYGVGANSEVIRLMIANAYREIEKVKA